LRSSKDINFPISKEFSDEKNEEAGNVVTHLTVSGNKKKEDSSYLYITVQKTLNAFFSKPCFSNWLSSRKRVDQSSRENMYTYFSAHIWL